MELDCGCEATGWYENRPSVPTPRLGTESPGSRFEGERSHDTGDEGCCPSLVSIGCSQSAMAVRPHLCFSATSFPPALRTDSHLPADLPLEEW